MINLTQQELIGYDHRSNEIAKRIAIKLESKHVSCLQLVKSISEADEN